MLFWISILVLSAAFSGLDQLIRLRWWLDMSWLPGRVFVWNSRVGKIDAWHTYQGATYLGLAAGFMLAALNWWMFIAVFLAWFQVRNLFMHVVWLKPEYWRWWG